MNLPPLNLSSDTAVIKEETTKLRKMLEERRVAIKGIEAECDAIRAILKTYQDRCTHPGQKTGYNERDGSWANTCPVCGESH